MKSVITYETLRYFTYSNDKLIRGSVRGVILDFMGLNGNRMFDEDPERGVELAGKGIAYMVPYLNPWNWMNGQAVAYTDELLDALRGRYGLGDGLPVVATGGSMGGLCALVYTRYARVTPVACVANCPVCDLPFHYTERPDLPRTLYSAFGPCGADALDAALRAHSPLHLVSSMPDIRYVIFHCEEDRAVNIHSHSEKFVAAMRAGHDIEYHTVPGRGHCDLDEAAWAMYRGAAEAAIAG
ncbi:MAG: prolyl oligopeptidase family serine peptidase [Clostridia bacterium]|nr:prolyl oligopeptidase family serine peptidase [Clostridia bacterium]